MAQVTDAAYEATLKRLLSDRVPTIGVSEAVKQDNTIFLDARKKEEYEVSHIPGAIWVGFSKFDFENIPEGLKGKDLVVYCSVGYRSQKITQKLRRAGYTGARNLYGGIFEWINQGHPVVDQQGATQNIHGYSKKWAIWLRNGNIVY
ncbi:rhodanese-like domain-containing protein [Robiginitalea sp. IMCC44478]|uniref:rhodanese-like domain-containing protein n=1 Tax=Robiginitalea sp. IMCC44478 TaxID=3459122 RepID=UPI00404118EA